jgi:hypothetical protein
MNGVQILVTPKGDRSGRLVARTEGFRDVQVGQVLLASRDGEPEAWKCWLWTAPEQHPAPTRSCEALTRPSTADLETVLNRRVEREGAWWA